MKRRSNRAIAICLATTAILVVADLWSKDWAQDTLSFERVVALEEVCSTIEGPDGRVYHQPQRLATNPRTGDLRRMVLVEGYFDFQYAENCGAAFGLMNDSPDWLRASVFLVAGLLATLVLLFLYVQGRGSAWFAWSVPLIVSGALGNFVDRARLGYVVDFIHVHYQEAWNYPTFNVADITITIGVVLLLLDSFVAGADDTEDGANPETNEDSSEDPPPGAENA